MEQYIQLGDRMWSPEVVASLPAGSRVHGWRQPMTEWEKGDDGRWHRLRDQVRSTNEVAEGGAVLSRVRGEHDLYLPMSFQRYLWHWRNTTRAGAIGNGTGLDETDQMIERFGIDDAERFPLASGLRIQDNALRDSLPVGSLIRHGDPAVPEWFAVFVRTDGGWDRVLGNAHLNQCDPHWACPQVTLLAVGGQEVEQPWVYALPAEGDNLRIHKFQRIAWRTAMENKSRYGWCSVIETIMAGSWISSAPDHSLLTGVDIGQTLTDPNVIASLPPGTVLDWPGSPPGEVHWYMRDNTSPGYIAARTRGLWSTRDGSGLNGPHWASGGMRVVAWPGQRIMLPPGVEIEHLWDRLPTGTAFRQDSGAAYTKAGDSSGSGYDITYVGSYRNLPEADITEGRGEYMRRSLDWHDLGICWMPGWPFHDTAEYYADDDDEDGEED